MTIYQYQSPTQPNRSQVSKTGKLCSKKSLSLGCAQDYYVPISSFLFFEKKKDFWRSLKWYQQGKMFKGISKALQSIHKSSLSWTLERNAPSWLQKLLAPTFGPLSRSTGGAGWKSQTQGERSTSTLCREAGGVESQVITGLENIYKFWKPFSRSCQPSTNSKL